MAIPFDVEGPVTAEIFVVCRTPEGLILTGPDGPQAWRVEAGPPEHPLETVRRMAEATLPGVLLVHSTSWRYEDDAVVLSFVVVIDDAAGMQSVAIGRADLARSEATAAPTRIDEVQVLEHGLRHLAWLAQEDEVVKATLDDGWLARLRQHVPEPFRQL